MRRRPELPWPPTADGRVQDGEGWAWGRQASTTWLSRPQGPQKTATMAVNLSIAHCWPHPVSLSAFLSLALWPLLPARVWWMLLSDRGAGPEEGRRPVLWWGLRGVESSGVKPGWSGALCTGNDDNDKDSSCSHFHSSFITSPTTSLEGERVGVIVMSRAADEGCSERESEVKNLGQRHPHSDPSLTLLL